MRVAVAIVGRRRKGIDSGGFGDGSDGACVREMVMMKIGNFFQRQRDTLKG